MLDGFCGAKRRRDEAGDRSLPRATVTATRSAQDQSAECADLAQPKAKKPTFAVIVRTFQWDPFIARQIARYREVSDGGDLFVSADETRGTLGPMGDVRCVGTTDAGLLGLGLPNRFAKGSLNWWNTDYSQYAFYRMQPDYDFYVFAEYDSLVRRPLAPIIEELARRQLDFVAAAMPEPLSSWFWWPYARQTYAAAELRATLNCVCILSRRALDMLFHRRLAMAADSSVKHWPISEAFVATEVARAGYSFAPLGDFGDTSSYDWFPPVLEEDLGQMHDAVFVHPVLDPPRYLASVLRYGCNFRAYFDPSSQMRQQLGRLPRSSYKNLLAAASWRRLKVIQQDRVERSILRAKLMLRHY